MKITLDVKGLEASNKFRLITDIVNIGRDKDNQSINVYHNNETDELSLIGTKEQLVKATEALEQTIYSQMKPEMSVVEYPTDNQMNITENDIRAYEDGRLLI